MQSSKDLERWQLEQMLRVVRPMTGYLSKLCRRTEELFLRDDPLRVKAQAAQAALQDLAMTMHYLSCKTGVGKSPDRHPKSGPTESLERTQT